MNKLVTDCCQFPQCNEPSSLFVGGYCEQHKDWVTRAVENSTSLESADQPPEEKQQ